MRCSKCRADNREGRKFCAQCGSPLAAKCPSCGASNEPGERFCGECGATLGAPAAAARRKPEEPQIRVAEASAPENLEGERKTVTALFADIKGATELSTVASAITLSPLPQRLQHPTQAVSLFSKLVLKSRWVFAVKPTGDQAVRFQGL